MKPTLLRLLRCPVCNAHPLEHQAFESKTIELTEKQIEKCSQLHIEKEMVSVATRTGLLICDACKTWYPIENFVPVMWKFRMPFHDKFERAHRDKSPIFTTHRAPSGDARPGERRTLINYSETWETLGEDELNFAFTHEQIQNIFRACLDWPTWALNRKGLRVLDVGIGYGFEAKNLQAVFDGEIFGIDLNLSVAKGGHLFYQDPFQHSIVCSLFDIPLPPSAFDAVISMGVLHHTYSTHDAFNAVVRHMKDDGFILIWLYGQEDYFGSNRLIFEYLLRERLLRPVIARLPLWLQRPVIYLISLYRYLPEKRSTHNPEKWRFKNTVHHTRDRYTPRYAHRHRFFEPIMWMDRLDMECRHLNYVLFEKKIGYWNNGVTVRGVKRTAPEAANNLDGR